MSEDVVVQLSGGLGNRIFQLAIGLACTHERPDLKVGYLDADIPTHHSRNVYTELVEAFKSQSDGTTSSRSGTAQQLYFTEHPEAPRTYNGALLRAVRELRSGEQVLLIRGYFQSPMYFKACSDVLETKLRGWLETTAMCSIDGWLAKHAVDPKWAFFVHVRLGDFVGNDQLLSGDRADRFLSVSLANWVVGIQSSSKSKAVVILLSNEPDAVDTHHPCISSILADAGIRVERVGANELDEVASMLLMSLCLMGGIVPGSTFSWWSAWLLTRSPTFLDGQIYTPDPWATSDVTDRERRCDLCTMLI